MHDRTSLASMQFVVCNRSDEWKCSFNLGPFFLPQSIASLDLAACSWSTNLPGVFGQQVNLLGVMALAISGTNSAGQPLTNTATASP